MFRTIRMAALVVVAALAAACSANGIADPNRSAVDPILVGDCDPIETDREDCTGLGRRR